MLLINLNGTLKRNLGRSWLSHDKPTCSFEGCADVGFRVCPEELEYPFAPSVAVVGSIVCPLIVLVCITRRLSTDVKARNGKRALAAFSHESASNAIL